MLVSPLLSVLVAQRTSAQGLHEAGVNAANAP
jgi:hypothetical protein